MGLGERFLLEAEAAFARIDEKPLTGPPWKDRRLPEGVRRMFMRRFRTRPFTFSSRTDDTAGDGAADKEAACVDIDVGPAQCE